MHSVLDNLETHLTILYDDVDKGEKRNNLGGNM